MSVFNALNSAIYGKLAGGTALTALLSGTAIYYLQAPPEAVLDYVVWSYQGGGDENLTPNRTKNLMVFVRGYSSAGPAKAGSIDAQVDALLHLKSVSASGWTNFWLARETDVATVEYDAANVPTWMSGAMYRVRLDAN